MIRGDRSWLKGLAGFTSLAPDGPRPVVLVAGDDSRPGPQGPGRAALHLGLRVDAALLERSADVRATPVVADSMHPAALVTCLHPSTTDAGAVVLTRTHPLRARAAQSVLRRVGRPVVTVDDVTVVGLAVATARLLQRGRTRPAAAHVLIAAARPCELLPELLRHCGVGSASVWTPADRPGVPLHRAAAGADAVIDRVGGVLGEILPDRRHDVVAEPFAHLEEWWQVAAGLVRGIAGHPRAACDLHLDVHRAVAGALTAEPAGCPDGPAGSDRRTTDLVEAVARGVLLRHPVHRN